MNAQQNKHLEIHQGYDLIHEDEGKLQTKCIKTV